MQEHWVGLVQPVHAQRGIVGHLHAKHKRQIDCKLAGGGLFAQHLLQVTFWQKFGDDHALAWHGASSHEQADIWVKNTTVGLRE